MPLDRSSISNIRRSVVANQRARAHYGSKGQVLLARLCSKRIEEHKATLSALMEGKTAAESLTPAYTAVLEVYLLTIEA
jgi:hypothetical protein